MSVAWKKVRLIEAAELNPILPKQLTSDQEVSFVPMSAVSAETAAVENEEQRTYAEVAKGFTPFVNGDVLVAKITPCFENGKIVQANLSRSFGFGSTEFHVVRPRPTKLDARYILHYLRQLHVRKTGERRMTGSAGQRRVPESFLSNLEIPLPSLAEQRRIAEVLDSAEALRSKRRAALAQLDSLTQSIFLDLFGDPVRNPRGWPTVRLEEALSIPLRNGISPSNTGKVSAKVLTLSAITGNSFDETALKVATFQSRPPATQAVDENDFLICRGNGNIRLVGKGYFPSHPMPDVSFPDTIIAARVSAKHLERAFLQQVWNSPAVRRQLESLARTTNGTFKVNQSMLEGVTFVAPPIILQREFGSRVRRVEKLKTVQRASLAELDALFASLEHRAFRGEL